MAMSPSPHLVVISSIALIKRGSGRRDLRLPAQLRPLPRNDHFGVTRYVFRRFRPPAPAFPPAALRRLRPSRTSPSALRIHPLGPGPAALSTRADSAQRCFLRSPAPPQSRLRLSAVTWPCRRWPVPR